MFWHRFTEEVIEGVFRWVLEEVVRAGYLSPEVLFVDGTHIKANANLKKHVKKSIPKAAKHYQEQLMKEVDADRAAHGKKPLKKDDDDDRPSAPPEEKETVESATDPECGVSSLTADMSVGELSFPKTVQHSSILDRPSKMAGSSHSNCSHSGGNQEQMKNMDGGDHYELALSVGKNGRINTVYNVGKIKEAPFPTNELKDSGRSQTERGRTASDARIAQGGAVVNNRAGLKKDITTSTAGSTRKEDGFCCPLFL